jgi:hypothetical protein
LGFGPGRPIDHNFTARRSGCFSDTGFGDFPRAIAGELFGFERMAAIAHLSAETVARAARDFGQDDDITVLTLTRLGAGATAPVPQVVAVCRRLPPERMKLIKSRLRLRQLKRTSC